MMANIGTEGDSVTQAEIVDVDVEAQEAFIKELKSIIKYLGSYASLIFLGTTLDRINEILVAGKALQATQCSEISKEQREALVTMLTPLVSLKMSARVETEILIVLVKNGLETDFVKAIKGELPQVKVLEL